MIVSTLGRPGLPRCAQPRGAGTSSQRVLEPDPDPVRPAGPTGCSSAPVPSPAAMRAQCASPASANSVRRIERHGGGGCCSSGRHGVGGVRPAGARTRVADEPAAGVTHQRHHGGDRRRSLPSRPAAGPVRSRSSCTSTCSPRRAPSQAVPLGRRQQAQASGTSGFLDGLVVSARVGPGPGRVAGGAPRGAPAGRSPRRSASRRPPFASAGQGSPRGRPGSPVVHRRPGWSRSSHDVDRGRSARGHGGRRRGRRRGSATGRLPPDLCLQGDPSPHVTSAGRPSSGRPGGCPARGTTGLSGSASRRDRRSRRPPGA